MLRYSSIWVIWDQSYFSDNLMILEIPQFFIFNTCINIIFFLFNIKNWTLKFLILTILFTNVMLSQPTLPESSDRRWVYQSCPKMKFREFNTMGKVNLKSSEWSILSRNTQPDMMDVFVFIQSLLPCQCDLDIWVTVQPYDEMNTRDRIRSI